MIKLVPATSLLCALKKFRIYDQATIKGISRMGLMSVDLHSLGAHKLPAVCRLNE